MLNLIPTVMVFGGGIYDKCTLADKSRLYWEGAPGREQENKGTQGNCSTTWFTVSGFMVMALIFGLSLTNDSDSGSFLR